jgi:TnpA family transposase
VPPEGDYGPLNPLARHRVSLAKTRAHWDDMTRVAGPLVTSQVRAYDLLRMLSRDGHPSVLGQAFAEYGRIAKTLHLLAFVDPADEGYRRTVHRQLTIQESRRHTGAALGQLRATGDVDDADAARLSPLADKHINMLGRYAFAPPAGPALCPLRDPASPGND